MSADQQLHSLPEEVVESKKAARGTTHDPDDTSDRVGPRVALLTPYDGGNFGDALIQDAVIANVRARLPGVQFSGISLSCRNFIQRHSAAAFPLCSDNRCFYGMSRAGGLADSREWDTALHKPHGESPNKDQLKRVVKRVPVVGWFVKTIYRLCARLWGELRHSVNAYRFLRGQNLVMVSGGGQLDEEWGGTRAHPFALFKWAILARIVGVPFVFTSVGAGKVTSTTSRFFLSIALRLARSRSYRDKNSREIASTLLRRAATDSVVPDLAFSLPSAELPASTGNHPISPSGKFVAISPIIYRKPGCWPNSDHGLYDRYLGQMALVVSQLLEGGYFVSLIWSSSDDEAAIPEILDRLDSESKVRVTHQISIATIKSWKDIVAALVDVDFLIASRLHSEILGFLTQKPTIAISFDSKVDWLMEDVGQNDYLLRIDDFTADDVMEALHNLELHRSIVTEQIGSYRTRIASAFAPQYDVLADYAMASYRSRK
jgi:polysaccharide pyruvyl transferase WcaK-like protein